MSSNNNFSRLNNTYCPNSLQPTSWDPYPEWQTQYGKTVENFEQDSNFRSLGVSWSPDKFNYTPDMNHNIALNFTSFKSRK